MQPYFKYFFIIFFTCLFIQRLYSQTLLQNGNYLDISSQKVIPFSNLVISNGIIISIDDIPLKTDLSNFNVIDLKGNYVSPGLIDAFSYQLPPEPEYLSRKGVIGSAVLGTKNPGQGKIPKNFTYFNFPRIPQEIGSENIVYSGKKIVFKKYNLEFSNDFIKSIRKQGSTIEIENQEELKELFIEWDDLQPSIIYIDMNGFPMDLLNDIVKGAKERGLKIVAYAETTGEALYSIEQGADIVTMSLGFGVDKEELLEFAETGIPLITSVSVFLGYGRDLRMEDEGEILYQKAKTNLGLFINAGGKTLIGNFYGAPWVVPGIPFDEIRVYKELGVDDADILNLLTLAPIEQLKFNNTNFSGKLGKIAPGYSASLIVTPENPLDNIDTLSNISKVFHNDQIISHDEVEETWLEVDLAYIMFFTRKEILLRNLVPPVEKLGALHLTLAPAFGGVLMEDGLNYFEFGLFSRLLIPSDWEYHQLRAITGAVFYDSTLFHTTIDYLHFFTPRFGMGVFTSILPNYHYIAGSHIQLQRIPYSSAGSRQWFIFDGKINFEEYTIEDTRLLAIRTRNFFNFYDFLPSTISDLKFRVKLDGGVMLNKSGQYLEESLVFNIGIRIWKNTIWKNTFWQRNLFGDFLTRFKFQASDGYMETYNILGLRRNYDETDLQNNMIGWLTEVEIELLSFSIFNLKTTLFWEMQKRDSNFNHLFVWDEKWIMDYGINFTLNLGNFGVLLGTYVPVTSSGKMKIPGIYVGVNFTRI